MLDLSRDAVSTMHVRTAVEHLKKAEASRQQARAAAELLEAIKNGNEDRQREARRQIATEGREDRAGLPRIVSSADMVARECPSPAVLITGMIAGAS